MPLPGEMVHEVLNKCKAGDTTVLSDVPDLCQMILVQNEMLACLVANLPHMGDTEAFPDYEFTMGDIRRFVKDMFDPKYIPKEDLKD